MPVGYRTTCVGGRDKESNGRTCTLVCIYNPVMCSCVFSSSHTRATPPSPMAFLVEKCGEMVVSMDSHKSVPAPFLTKTYQLVDDSCTDHIVSWGEDDGTFVVWRPPEFARDLLPNYFKHNNFSSFVRQLNTYGFRKIVADRWEFANEFFRKGQKHLLSEIHRRKSSQIPQHYHHCSYSSDPVMPPFLGTDGMGRRGWGCLGSPAAVVPTSTVGVGSSCTTDHAHHHFLSALSEDNQRLRRRNSVLLSELTHMKKLYGDIIFFLQHHVSPVPADQRSIQVSTLQRNANRRPLLEIGPSVNDDDDEDDHHRRHGNGGIHRDGSVKLFGVPLHGNSKKRLHPEQEEEDEDGDREMMMRETSE